MTRAHILSLVLCAACLPPPPASTAAPSQTDPASSASGASASTAAPEGGFPIVLIAGPGEGPSLYRGASAEDPAVGYVSPGVAVEVTGPVEGDRVPVRIRGALKVRGYLVAQRLYARVQRRGRIRGTPIYVAGNDLVRVVGFTADGRVQVSVRAGNDAGTLGETYTGSYPVAGLGSDEAPTNEETRPPGTACRLAGSGSVELRESAGGAVVATFPAGSPCRNVREEGGAFAVLVGTGPYVAGYVAQAPTASQEPRATALGRSFGTGGALPVRLRANGEHTLMRIAAGTRIRFDETTIAMLDTEGRARVIERFLDTNEADVFVAVDDSVAVRGLVSLEALSNLLPQ